ncbi:inositol monophosphatase family protein [Nesterenkonia alkaliphila]|uniref:inositol-phosphate phosphatase n=1 Tax=Nesterenkonia alkaliphila TaxID=1463631 RepID=A0A7K1UHP2_9MICC|nr:inositol monophosphatase family protein [Nesterenkonia alkaliphila]MVT25988.1 inositol monophosphatase [Nesterenkonia alkaliphila]GFZ96160.1 inositol phosphatase [Nesterenkonia alkaliphila]
MSHLPEAPALPAAADLPASAELRRIAVTAAHTAGEPLKTAFRSHMEIQEKTSNTDLVTIWDKQTEETLISLLSAEVPDSRITGEEGGQHGTGRVEWIIDPIDGTSNFAHGFDLFTISIGAAVDDVVIAGVVYDPINELTFSADDHAAYLRVREGAESVLKPTPKTGVAEPQLNLLTNFPGTWMVQRHGEEALRAFGEFVTTYATVRRIVSGALELCHVAAGWADVVVNCRTNPWDIAAAQLILTRAGGTFKPYGTRGDLAFDGTPAVNAHLAPGYVGLGSGVESPTAPPVAARFVWNQS